MDKREENKEKIITATINCIEKYGIKDTTTRNISQLAGVNISAISYYFQGRDNLINIVYDKTLENAFSIDDISIEKDDDYKTVLRKILKDWLQGAYAFPNITKAHFDSLINNSQQGQIMFDKINDFIDVVYAVLLEHNMPDEKIQREKLYTIFSALFGYILVGSYSKDIIDDDTYIDIVLSNI